MRRCWIPMTLALALGALAVPAWADDPPAAPAAPVPAVVDGSVLLPATDVIDPEPFPLRCPDPTPPAGHGYMIYYGGAYLLQPTFQTDAAFLRTGAGGAAQQVDFTRHINYAPAGGLAIGTGRGWGLRGAWFNFSESGNADAVAAPGETLTPSTPLSLTGIGKTARIDTDSNMRVTAWDAEGTYVCYSSSLWSLLLGSGVRVAHVSQDYVAYLTDAKSAITTVGAGHNFNGAGPTFSTDGRYTCVRNSNLALYSKLRFSLLFGMAKEDYFTDTPAGKVNNQYRSENQTLPIGELEVGAEYSRPLGNARVFVQSGFVGQIWWGGGNSSNFDPLANSSAAGTNFGFIGVALRAGLAF